MMILERYSSNCNETTLHSRTKLEAKYPADGYHCAQHQHKQNNNEREKKKKKRETNVEDVVNPASSVGGRVGNTDTHALKKNEIKEGPEMLLLSLNCSSFSLFLRFAECEITAQRTQVDASFPTHTAVYTFFFFLSGSASARETPRCCACADR